MVPTTVGPHSHHAWCFAGGSVPLLSCMTYPCCNSASRWSRQAPAPQAQSKLQWPQPFQTRLPHRPPFKLRESQFRFASLEPLNTSPPIVGGVQPTHPHPTSVAFACALSCLDQGALNPPEDLRPLKPRDYSTSPLGSFVTPPQILHPLFHKLLYTPSGSERPATPDRSGGGRLPVCTGERQHG